MDNIIFRELPTQSKLPSPSLALIMQDKEGFFWYGTNGEGLCRDDGYNIRVYNSKGVGKGIMDNDEVTCFSEDRHNRIWFGTRMGLYILDKKKEQIKKVSHSMLMRKKVNNVCMDSNGKMWVGIAQSIIRFNKDGEAEKVLSIGTNSREEVKEIMLDSKGTLWITILRGGIYRIKKASDTLEKCPWDLDVAASYIIESKDRRFYWVGTWGKGVVKYEESGHITVQDEQMMLNNFSKEVNNMMLDTLHDIMWVSTMDDIYAYAVSGNRITRLSTTNFLPTEKKLIGKIICDNRGNVWVPGSSPHTFALSWTQGAIKRHEVKAMTSKLGYQIMVDRIVREGDYYWIYQRRTRLSLYNAKTGDMSFMANEASPSPLSTQKVLAKCRDKAGVWTCNGRRLIHAWHDGMRIHWEECTEGKVPNYISALNDLGSGKLLIGTEKQVMRYDYHKHQLEQLTDSVGIIRLVDWKDSKLSYSTVPNALPSVTDRHGHQWTLTEKCITESNPRTKAERVIYANDPNIDVEYFTDITLADDSVCVGGIGAFLVIAPCKELDKAQSDERIVLIDSTHVSTLNHLHSDVISYAYRFVPQGFSPFAHATEWKYTEAGHNDITYDSLSCGSYTLEVKCRDEYGRWTKTQTLRTFRIPMQSAYIVSIVFAVLTLFCSVVFLLTRKKKAKEAPTTNATQEQSDTDNKFDSTEYKQREADEFMEKMHLLVMQNIDNANYGNEQLAQDMNISRSNFYRRFQKYSGTSSASEYIRKIRLNEGRRLLQTTTLSIAEVAYNVGFSSSQYFAKCFKEQFGITPKEARK
ncbi:MAG: helix-turn-helix domain-containing protein [Bacteroidaceae bacterium]|nr:helix-turn-helix domain-containing protein [Bacteroidaceae bacterium]